MFHSRIKLFVWTLPMMVILAVVATIEPQRPNPEQYPQDTIIGQQERWRQEQEAAWQRAIERNPMTCIELQKRWLVHRQAFRDCRLNTVDPRDCKGSTEKYRDSLAALRIECRVFLRSPPPPLPWETAGHGVKVEENFKRPD